jgi:hypothetical protein
MILAREWIIFTTSGAIKFPAPQQMKIHPKLCRSNPRGDIRYHIRINEHTHKSCGSATQTLPSKVQKPTFHFPPVLCGAFPATGVYYIPTPTNRDAPYAKFSATAHRMPSHSTPNIECTIGSWRMLVFCT